MSQCTPKTVLDKAAYLVGIAISHDSSSLTQFAVQYAIKSSTLSMTILMIKTLQ